MIARLTATTAQTTLQTASLLAPGLGSMASMGVLVSTVAVFMDAVITDAGSTGGVGSMIGDAALADASARASTAAGSGAVIVASTAAVAFTERVLAVALEGSTAVEVVDSTAVEVADFTVAVVDSTVAVAATAADTGKTSKFHI